MNLCNLQFIPILWRNAQSQGERNTLFLEWLQTLVTALRAMPEFLAQGAPSYEIVPSGQNPFYVTPWMGWLIVNGFNIFCTQSHLCIITDPIAWVRTQIRAQLAFGRVLKVTSDSE